MSVNKMEQLNVTFDAPNGRKLSIVSPNASWAKSATQSSPRLAAWS